MKIFKPTILLLGSAMTLSLSSCDKVSDLVSKFTEEEQETTISEDELTKSDAATARYLAILERVPLILSKVNSEKSAFQARKQLDEVSHEIDLVVVDLVDLDGAPKSMLSAKLAAEPKSGASKSKSGKSNPMTSKRKAPSIAGGIYWHIRQENQEAYKKRATIVAQRIQAHIYRIAQATERSPVAYDVVMDGVMTMASTRKAAGENAYPGITPLPEGWMPMGMSPQ